MADRRGVVVAARRRWLLIPWWGQVLLVVAATRVVTTALMLMMLRVEAQLSGAPRKDLLATAASWDGQWYLTIIAYGYPSTLPLDAEGHVVQNAWAFMPVYPTIVGGLMALGIPFALAGVMLSLVGGVAACLLLFAVTVQGGASRSSALYAVVLLCLGPMSVMFQVTYAESLGLAFLFGAIWLIQRRMFFWALPVIIVMALTRPLALAFALFLLLYFVVRIVQAWRDRAAHPLPPRDIAGIIFAGLTSFVAGMSWTVFAWMGTGSMTAYTDTELAWRAGYVGRGGFEPFIDWFLGVAFWIRYFFHAQPVLAGVLSVLVTVTAVALLALVLMGERGKRLGIELRLWVVSYPIYLLAVFFPQSSTWRLLLPMAPILGAARPPRTWWGHLLVAGALVLLQALWIYGCWIMMPGDWSPP